MLDLLHAQVTAGEGNQNRRNKGEEEERDREDVNRTLPLNSRNDRDEEIHDEAGVINREEETEVLRELLGERRLGSVTVGSFPVENKEFAGDDGFRARDRDHHEENQIPRLIGSEQRHIGGH